MGYLGSARGDYLGARRGDPGLFGFLGKVGRGIARTAGGIIPGPAGMVLRAVGGSRAKPIQRQMPIHFQQPIMRMPAVPVVPTPGLKGMAQRILPGGQTGFQTQEQLLQGFGRKRRRMNVANPKALRRSIRRQAGFVKLARRALTGTGYKIVSRGSSSRPKNVTVRESGPGGVSVR